MSSTRADEVILASVYMISIVASIVPYIIILILIKRRPKQFSGSAYNIMFSLGIADCIQLIFHSFAFVSTMFDSTFSYWINKICGSILNGAWFTYISFTLLLAFNRFIMLCLPMKNANALDGSVMKFLLILVWLPCILLIILCLTPECSMIYYIEGVSWDYTDENWCPIIDVIDFYWSISQCLLGAVFYILIFGKLLLVRKKHSVTNKKYNGEIKLLFQASLIGGYTIFSEVAWHFAGGIIEDELLSAFLGNILWIGESGLTPYIYLLINNSMRNAFLETLGLKKPSFIAPTTVAPTALFSRRNSSFVVVRALT